MDATDDDFWKDKRSYWDPAGSPVTVSQAFSDVDNRYAFQGVPHFVMDTAANATAANAKLILGHHRARLVDVMTGRWNTRDPLVNREKSLRQTLNSHAGKDVYTYMSSVVFHTR